MRLRNSGKINGAVAVRVDLVDHVLQLGLGRVLAEGAHDGTELLGGDRAVSVLIEQGEGFLELRDLLVSERVCHFAFVSSVSWLRQGEMLGDTFPNPAQRTSWKKSLKKSFWLQKLVCNKCDNI